MRTLTLAGLLLCSAASSASGQIACPSPALEEAAREVTQARHHLQGTGVPADTPAVPEAVASQLIGLKNALAQAAMLAFRCAGPEASAENLQHLLAVALHANLPAGDGGALERRGSRDFGAYGADLAVQVFQLFGTPRIYEVDFRYGLECGDDNLLLLFRAANDTTVDPWRLEMRYEAASYKTVGDALGDFVLLSPLTGSSQHPVWRYLVAHGRPTCGETPRPSTFSLDLLTPTEDPARPEHAWHFEHDYLAGSTMPRLATTEDTVDFRLVPLPAANTEARKPITASEADSSKSEVYRFHLTTAGKVEPVQNEHAVDGVAGPPSVAAKP